MTKATIIQFPSGNPAGDRKVTSCVPPQDTFEMQRRSFGNLVERLVSDIDHLTASALVGDEAAIEAIKAYSDKCFEIACKAKMLAEIVRVR